jgi:hypothetical protein
MIGFATLRFWAIRPPVREYQRQIVRMIVTVITLVPLARKAVSARICGCPLAPLAE